MKRDRFSHWPELITGILLALMGLISFVLPSFALTMMALLYGLIALLSGIGSLVGWFTIERPASEGFTISLIIGIFNTLVGIYLLFNVGAGRATISFIFPVWLILFCVSQLARLRQVRFYGGTAAWVFTIVASILGLVISVLLLFNWALSGIILVYVLGGYLIIQGGSSIFTAIMRWRRGM